MEQFPSSGPSESFNFHINVSERNLGVLLSNLRVTLFASIKAFVGDKRRLKHLIIS